MNAYHQPGVEAGKKAAAAVLALQQHAVEYVQQHPDESFTVEQLAERLDASDQVEALAHVLEHLAANKRYITHRGERYRAKKS